jgi:electron transport complex protein RnfE
MNAVAVLMRGIVKENPTFRLVLGLCPTLAVTTTLENALGMGLATTLVLICSNMVISALRSVIPPAVRIPSFIVLIASFTTIVHLLIQGYAEALDKSLGIFIPLIAVNCIIFARAEAFASKNKIFYSAVDGVGMGLGFTIALSMIATIREFVGSGSITLWGKIALTEVHDYSMVLFALPAGGFVTLALLLAGINHFQSVAAKRNGKPAPAPLEFDCRHCTICKKS